MFGTILDDFDIDARVMTLWYFLQGIIEICCLEIKKCARMVLFDRDEGGGRTRFGWGSMNSYGKRTRGQDHI